MIRRLMAFLLLSVGLCVAQGLPLGGIPISSGGGGGTITVTTGTRTQANATSVTATSVNVSAGETIILFATSAAAATFTVTDTSGVGGTWTQDVCQNIASGGFKTCAWRKTFASAASAFSIQESFTGASATFNTIQYLRATNLSASPYLGMNSASGNSTSPAVSLTPASAGSLLIAYGGGSSNIAAVAPFTNAVTGTATGDQMIYYVDPSAGAITATFSQTTGVWDAVGFIYK